MWFHIWPDVIAKMMVCWQENNKVIGQRLEQTHSQTAQQQ